MEKMKVRDLMRPVDEFPRISNQLTVLEAIDALEEAQDRFLSGRALQRILLVCDEQGEIVGKLSPMDVVQGLEPNYEGVEGLANLPRYRLPESMLESMKRELRLWMKPLSELCAKANGLRIERFVKLPTPDHMVAADESMDKAFHLFVVGRHDSLFVKEADRIVGVLRFSDVYKSIVKTMRECPAE